MTRLTDVDLAARAMTEKQLQTRVIDLARSLGYGVTLTARRKMLEEAAAYGVEAPPLDGLVFHPHYSLGSEPGWPDLTLIRRADRRLVFAELKSQKRDLSPRQVEVVNLLRELAGPRVFAAGIGTSTLIEVHVWRPSDLASGRVAEVLR